VGSIIDAIEKRKKIISFINSLPSIAKRNMKNDIREMRNPSKLKKYFDQFEYFIAHYKLLSNRDKSIQVGILKKMFNGNNTTLSDLLQFVEDKENLLGGADFTKNDIIKMAESNDFHIIYESGNHMIVEVNSAQGIKAIGCNSFWCFTYGSGFQGAMSDWQKYSYNDIVYVIIDFSEDSDSADFMHVVIKPLMEDNELIEYDDEFYEQHPIFNMANENYSNPYFILENLFGSNYIDIIKKYLNFDE